MAKCDSVCPQYDYDTPVDAMNKRFTKSVKRTEEYADRVFNLLPVPEVDYSNLDLCIVLVCFDLVSGWWKECLSSQGNRDEDGFQGVC